MNCKPGDLALVVKGRNRGKVVTCVRLLNGGPQLEQGVIRDDEAVWELDRVLSWPEGPAAAICDHGLMPIRPLPGEPIEDITERPIKRGSPA